MAEPDPLVPLLAALRDLTAWFLTDSVPHIIIGGVAASILGRPRMTRDIDALVILEESKWQNLLDNGAAYGFAARIPDAVEFAGEARMLLVQHVASSIDIDIAFGLLPFEVESVDQRQAIVVGGISLNLPLPEDLIVMKAVAHRPRDLADIESLFDTHPQLDFERIREWSQAFAAALDMPEIWDDVAALAAKHRRRLE